MIKLLAGFVIGAISAGFWFKEDVEALIEKKRVVQYEKQKELQTIREEAPKEVYIIQPDDSHRLQDCTDEDYEYHGGRLKSHPFMKFYEGRKDPLNGFLLSDKSPVYNYLHGLSTLDDDTVVLMGFRGNTAGPHRSRVTTGLEKIRDEYNNVLVYMPSSFYNKDGTPIEDKKTTLQSICHRRRYEGKYIGSAWPGMNYGYSWKVYDRLLKNKAHVFVFSYSNGQIVREDILDTKFSRGFRPNYVSIANYFEFLEQYSKRTEFIRKDKIPLLDGAVDFETNYSGEKPLWDLAKFIKEQVDGNPTRMYYAACGIESVVAINHIKLIKSLGLIGVELPNGVVRYMNDTRNVIIDVLTFNKPEPYVYANVDLIKQTTFLKDNRVGKRLSLGHYMIVPYAADQFKQLAAERGLLKSK